MKQTHKHPVWQRWISITLVLIMFFGLVGCHTEPGTTTSGNLEKPTSGQTTPSTTEPQPSTTLPVTEPTDPPTEPTEPPTEPTEPPTQPTEPAPTDPPAPPEPDPNELVYELTQEDVDEFYRLLTECETVSIAGTDMEAIEAANTALDEKYEYLNAQNSIAMILYYSDMKNQALTDQHLACVDICTSANDAYIQMVRRVYESDTPAKDALFEGWTDEDIAQLLAYDEQIATLQQRNSEIGVEYRAAVSDDVRIPLYIEFIQNNNQIAQFYGYDNYYTYAYDLVYERDYDPDELQLMRQYAKTYLAGTFDTALTNFQNTFYKLIPAQQNSIVSFLYDDYNTLDKDYVRKFLGTMPDSMETEILGMLDANSLFATAPGAMAGAFTTMIGDRSYCFFGPGYANSCTVIHEAGHYYASRYNDLNAIPLDLAETHSQGNEWLFIQYMKSNMTKSKYNAMVNYRLYNDLAMILICLMVDEFEQQVYTTDLTGFTAEDFDAIMDNICSQYFTLEYAASYLTDVNAYWRMVVVDQPVYYISYAVSSIAAIDLYTVAAEDFSTAVSIYQQLCEQPVTDAGFLGNITAAGLAGPFEESFYLELQELINSRKP